MNYLVSSLDLKTNEEKKHKKTFFFKLVSLVKKHVYYIIFLNRTAIFIVPQNYCYIHFSVFHLKN